MRTRLTVYLLSAITALFFLLPVSSSAQEEIPPLAEMWLGTARDGHQAEFREGIAEHMKFRAENGDPREWQVYTPVLGDKLNQFGIRSCCINWADVDSYREWSRGNKSVRDHFEKHVAPHAVHWEHYFETLHWNQSHWSDKAREAKLFAVTEFHVIPGHEAEFREAREKLSQIALNQGWANADRSWIWATTIGGPSTESVIVPHSNFASMGRPDDSFARFLATHIGEERAAALLKQFAGSTSGSEYQIWELQKDLSMQSDN